MKILARYLLGILLVTLILGCTSQQTATPQQATVIPTVTVSPTFAVAPTLHSQVISVQNASSLKLEKIIGAGKVNDVAWSPLGGIIVVAQDFDISFYDSVSLQLVGNIGFGGTEVVFSPDGLFVAIVKDIGIIIWDVERKISVQEFETTMARINYVIYNSDGAYLAVLGDSSITSGDPEYVLEVWDIVLGKRMIFDQGYDSEANIAFSPDGGTLAFANVSQLTLFRPATGEKQKLDLTWENGSLSYISDDVLLKRADNNRLKTMDLRTLKTLNLISVDNGGYSEFQVSPDKRKIIFPNVWNSERYLWITQVWDLETKSLLYTLDFYSNVTRIDFSPDSKYFISADYDGFVRIYDLQSGKTIHRMEFTSEVQDVDFLSMNNGEMLIMAGYYQGQVRFWNFDVGEVVRRFKGFPYWGNTVSISPDQKLIITKSDYSIADIWDVDTGNLYRTINCPDDHTMYNVFLLEDESTVVAECGNSIVTWDLKAQKRTPLDSGAFLKRIPADHRLAALSASDARSGIVVADSSGFEVVDVFSDAALFNISLPKENPYMVISDVAFSSDGKMFALGDQYNGNIDVWDREGDAVDRILAGHRVRCYEGGCSSVNDLAFHPYGYLLASAGDDKTVRLWDAYSGKQLAVLNDISNAASSVAFSPDGRYLIAGCDDGRIYVWSIEL